MKYDAAAVKNISLNALSASSRCWIPGSDAGNTEAVSDAKKRFSLTLIDPELDVVNIEPNFAEILGRTPGLHAVWYITKLGEQRVFFDESNDSFGVGWGPDKATGYYADLGFRTFDPLDAYLASSKSIP